MKLIEWKLLNKQLIRSVCMADSFQRIIKNDLKRARKLAFAEFLLERGKVNYSLSESEMKSCLAMFEKKIWKGIVANSNIFSRMFALIDLRCKTKRWPNPARDRGTVAIIITKIKNRINDRFWQMLFSVKALIKKENINLKTVKGQAQAEAWIKYYEEEVAQQIDDGLQVLLAWKNVDYIDDLAERRYWRRL
tara:strand:+ start:95597 stop:96172 length:576 start_codon:yes stop_codon:yes gene_type:complete